MTGKAKTPSKKPSEPESPCGSNCPDFAEKICPGEDSGCAIYWRFTQGLT
nr:hypothetical protein [uncultured Methanoregula sp.]